MADQAHVYVGVAGYFGKPDHPGKVGVFRRPASGPAAAEAAHMAAEDPRREAARRPVGGTGIYR